MWFQHLKIAWRKLFRQKGFSTINLFGLAVGLAATLLTVAYVHHQYSFDRFHEFGARLYKVSAEHQHGQVSFNSERFAPGLGLLVQERIPAVESYSRLWPGETAVVTRGSGQEKFTESRFFFADSNFLHIFSFELLAGNKEAALREPFSVLLTPSMAEKYFGRSDPIGRTIEYRPLSTEMLTDEADLKFYSLTVSGIIAPAPGNSSIQYDFVASFGSLQGMMPAAFQGQAASLGFVETFLLLPEGQAAPAVSQQIEDLFSKNEETEVSISLQTLPDTYFNDAMRKKLGLFIGIAVLILLLAVVNYASLTTARATQRAKEVGVRKTLGARRAQLMGQFFGESGIMVVLGFLLSMALSRLALPLINRLADTQIDFQVFVQPLMLMTVATVLLLSIFLAGSYPAIALSRFLPAHVLRTGQGTALQGEHIRRLLLVFQFVISAALITCSLVMQSQMQYLGKRDLGFDRDRLLVIPFKAEREGALGTFKSRVLTEPAVVSAGISTSVPFNPQGTSIYFANKPSGEPVSLFVTNVDRDFLATLGVSWSSRSTEGAMVFGTGSRAIINTTAREMLELEKGLGDRIMQGSIGGEAGLEVSGIIEDYIFSGYKNEVGPQVLIELSDDQSQGLTRSAYLTVRLQPGTDIQKMMDRLVAIYNDLEPIKPFDFFFIDEAYDRLYRSETRTAALFQLFTLLAIFIACLGLLGLSAFVAERRAKEIGIRKVFGATVAHIVALLSRDFLLLVGLALVIALPLAWYVMNRWLQEFAYRIDLAWGLFALAGLLALLITLLTVGFQSVKAALANPVRSLRNE